MSTTGGIKIFSGNANPRLVEEICGHLTCDMGKSYAERFSDGEFNFQIDENVRGGDVFIVQPTCPPTDAHLMGWDAVVYPGRGRTSRGIAEIGRGKNLTDSHW